MGQTGGTEEPKIVPKRTDLITILWSIPDLK